MVEWLRLSQSSHQASNAAEVGVFCDGLAGFAPAEVVEFPERVDLDADGHERSSGEENDETEEELDLEIPPLGKGEDVGGESDKGIRLARSLKEATERMVRKESVARKIFGDEFVDHFGGTREHEYRLWDEAVTD